MGTVEPGRNTLIREYLKRSLASPPSSKKFTRPNATRIPVRCRRHSASRGSPSATGRVCADQPLHFAEELLVTDRLFEIAVEALGEQPLAIALHRERGERNNLERRGTRLGAQAPERRDAVQAGHLHVHEDEIGRMRECRLDALGGALGAQ